MANVTASITLCATEVKEYSVAVDLSRCHLKLFGSTATGDDDSATGTHHGHDHSHNHSHGHPFPAMPKPKAIATVNLSTLAMWLLRGRAFAGLGSAYLANIHFRQVKALQPHFPGIQVVLDYLDEAEVEESILRSRCSTEVGACLWRGIIILLALVLVRFSFSGVVSMDRLYNRAHKNRLCRQAASGIVWCVGHCYVHIFYSIPLE